MPPVLHWCYVLSDSISTEALKLVEVKKNWEVLEKAEEPEIKLPTSAGSWKKEDNSRKTSTFALLIMPKSLTV